MEVTYEFDGFLYRVIESQDVHDSIANDENYAVQYFQQNKSNLEVVAVDTDLESGNVEELPDSLKWDSKNTKLLIDLYSKVKEAFRDPKIKKRSLWAKIENEFVKRGYKNVSIDILDTKFRNMKKTFKTILDNNKRKTTGRGRISWPYYDDFDNLFRDDRTVNFGHTISSTIKKPAIECTPDIQSAAPISSVSIPLNSLSPTNISVTPSCTFPASDPTSTRTTRTFNTVSNPPLCEPESEPSSSVSTMTKSQQKVVKSQRGKKLYEFRKRQLETEEKRIKELAELKKAILQSNEIQQRRNELLERLVICQEQNKK